MDARIISEAVEAFTRAVNSAADDLRSALARASEAETTATETSKLGEFARRLAMILDSVGCGELPEPSVDTYNVSLSYLAEQAADAAYSAVQDAIGNAEIDADEIQVDMSEAQDAVNEAVSEARALLADIREEEARLGSEPTVSLA